MSVGEGLVGIERWTAAVEDLKDLALTEHCLVVAISALDRESLSARRVGLDGFRGAQAVAHEADVAIAMNEKLKVVSRAHLAYSTTLYDSFSRAVVFSIEKNRRGMAPLEDLAAQGLGPATVEFPMPQFIQVNSEIAFVRSCFIYNFNSLSFGNSGGHGGSLWDGGIVPWRY